MFLQGIILLHGRMIADTALLHFLMVSTGHIAADTPIVVESRGNEPLWCARGNQTGHFSAARELPVGVGGRWVTNITLGQHYMGCAGCACDSETV